MPKSWQASRPTYRYMMISWHIREWSVSRLGYTRFHLMYYWLAASPWLPAGII